MAISVMHMGFYTFLVLGLLLLGANTATADENPFERYERYSTVQSTDVLTPNATNIYHINMEPPKRMFDNPNPPAFMLYSFEIQGNGTFLVTFLRGKTERPGGFLRDYSSNGSVTEFARVYWLSSDDGEDFTIIVLSEEETNITYEVFIGLFREESRFWFYVGSGVGLGTAIIAVVVVWHRHRSSKIDEDAIHTKEAPEGTSFSSPSSPADKPFGPSHPSVRKSWSFAPPRPRTQLFPTQYRRGQASNLRCPSCKQLIGTRRNRVRFHNIKFIVSSAKEEEKQSTRVIRSKAVFCENCMSVIDITKR